MSDPSGTATPSGEDGLRPGIGGRMLVNKSHLGWIVGTILVGTAASAPWITAALGLTGDYTPGSVEGIWLGVVALGLMIWAALLSAVRLSPGRLRFHSPRVLARLTGALALASLAVVLGRVVRADGQTAVRWTQAGLTVIALAWAVPVVTRVGPRRAWLEGHIWLGLLSGWFVVLHSRLGFGGLLEQILWVLLVLTLLTGIYGLALQQSLPRAMTDQFPAEVPVGQHDHACRLLRAEADQAVEVVCGAGAMTGGAWASDDEFRDARRALAARYQDEIREFLAMPYARTSRLADPLQAEGLFTELQRGSWRPEDRVQLRTIQDLCARRRLLGEQERLHGRLHRWLWWHIPLSSALIALGAVHAVASLWY